MRRLSILLTLSLLWTGARNVQAIDPYAGNDPFWVMLHEPEVVAELKFSAAQRSSYQKMLDELDARFFPLRNKSAEVARAGAAKISAEARDELKKLLLPGQHKRLTELLLRQMGNKGLLSDDVVKQLQITESQRQKINEQNEKTQTAVTALQKELAEGKPRGPLDKKYNELQSDFQKKLAEVLKPEQQSAFAKLLGASFDLAKIGQPAFRAPELVNTDEWINSAPLQLEKLRGKVVVVHFYAFGCSNCIHNYPWYHQWHDQFKDKDVALIGIHTPETATERDATNVRRKANDEKFKFPILIDGKNENWNAWGNSMWPSVYLVDKRGYLREFWPGELKWQGNDGEKYMRDQIERLLAE